MSEYRSYSISSRSSKQINDVKKEEHKRRERLRQEREERNRQDTIDQNKQKGAQLSAYVDKVLARKDLKDFLNESSIQELKEKLIQLLSDNEKNPRLNEVSKLSKGIEQISKKIDAEERKAEQRLSDYIIKQEKEKGKKSREMIAVINEQFNELQKREGAELIQDNIQNFQNELDSIKHAENIKNHDLIIEKAEKIGKMYTEACQLRDRKKDISEKMQGMLKNIEDQSNDQVVQTWVGQELNQLKQHVLNSMSSLPADHHIDKYEQNLNDFAEIFDRLLRTANSKQEDELARKYIVQTIMQALQEENFSVSQPRLEERQDGCVVITGIRPGRNRKQHVELKIDLDGQVHMDIDGGDRDDVARIRQAKVNKSLEQQVACRKVAEEFKEFVAKKGLPLQEVERNWHNPERIAKGEQSLPHEKGKKYRR